MDNSFHEQGSDTQRNRESFLTSLSILARIIKRLTSFIKLTEAEWEDAGIFLGRIGGE